MNVCQEIRCFLEVELSVDPLATIWGASSRGVALLTIDIVLTLRLRTLRSVGLSDVAQNPASNIQCRKHGTQISPPRLFTAAGGGPVTWIG